MSLCKKLQFKSSYQTKTSIKYLLLTSVNTFKLNSQSVYFSNKISQNVILYHEKLFLGLRNKFSKILNIETKTTNRSRFIKSSTILATFSGPNQTSKLNDKQVKPPICMSFKNSKRLLNFNKKMNEKSRNLIEKIFYFYKNISFKLECFKFKFDFSNYLNKKNFISLSAACGLFTWDDYKITDDEIKNEVDEILTLFSLAKDAQKVDENSPHKVKIDFEAARLIENEEWKLIYDKKNLLIWRRNITLSTDDEADNADEKGDKPNYDLFEYKVLGRFNDITPLEFYLTQTDLDYRKDWDYLAVSLCVIAREPITKTELVQWIMRFPYPLYPREYVYVRRYCVDLEEKLLILVSKSVPRVGFDPKLLYPIEETHDEAHQTVQHHNFFHNQSATEYVRVTNYKSNIIVLPHGDFDKPGLDYVIQYYDINKAKIPKLAYKWMATSGLPDYIEKVHKAAVKLKRINEENHTNESELMSKFEVFYLNKKIVEEPIESSKNVELSIQENVKESLVENIKRDDEIENVEVNKSEDKIINAIKIHLFIVMKKFTDDFFSLDEPHPIFYN